MTVTVRSATSADVPALHAIYAHHVLNGLGTFEETAPDHVEMVARFAAVTGAGYPYLVAEADGQVLGYAYASAFRARSAYRFTVEDSVYVAAEAARRGIGRLLMEALITACRDRGFRQMLAVIGDSENLGSIGLHRALGFTMNGVCAGIGFKHGRWVDVVFMQRDLT